MISTRQEELLKLIIENYIKNARPVSSKSLSDIMNCSSATVRSEMGALEESHLLEKTHISSGRVPSEKGYRYYVDNIMKPKQLTEEEKTKLETLFANNRLMINDTIKKSMEIISELTSYTTIILGNSSKENKISKVEVVPISDTNLIGIIVTDKGYVEHLNINMEEIVSINDIKQTIDLINKLLVGTPLDEANIKLEYEIKPIIGKYIKQHEVIYNAFYNAFSDITHETNVKMAGTKNMLMQPEFNDTAKIRSIINKFEDKEIVNSIKEEDNDIKIYIGSENDFDEDVAVIKTKYSLNGTEGTIALIGPKRMEYDRVITLLNYIKENIK